MKKNKVLAYLTRINADTVELLVFRHRDFPDAGLQVPGGSIDTAETPMAAAHREIFEESG